MQDQEVKCISGKRYYNTFWAANRENRTKSKTTRLKMDVYRCKFCNGWHLSGHNKDTEVKRRSNAKWK